MADEQQITDALNVLKKGKASVILLHCKVFIQHQIV